MLNEADPTAPESGDPPELAGAEEGVINSMAPLIDTGKSNLKDHLKKTIATVKIQFTIQYLV